MQPSLWTLQFLDLGSNPRPLHRLRSLNHWTVSEVPELPALKPALPALSKLGPARATLPGVPSHHALSAGWGAPWLSCRQTHPDLMVGLSAPAVVGSCAKARASG